MHVYSYILCKIQSIVKYNIILCKYNKNDLAILIFITYNEFKLFNQYLKLYYHHLLQCAAKHLFIELTPISTYN